MNVTQLLLFIFGCFLCISINFVDSTCTISSDWRPISRDVRLLMASAVVYGKTKEHKASQIQVEGKPFYVIDAVFQVYCIIKQGAEPISEEITIQRISPRDGCSGTTQNMKIGEEAFVAIKPTSDGEFEYDEVMPTMSATFPASKDTFIALSAVCHLQTWATPHDARISMCPVCGVNNFTDNVMTTSDNDKMPCVFDGTDFSDVSNCDTFSTVEIDPSATCIPANFNHTCTRVIYSPSEVTCYCDNKQRRPGAFSEIDAGNISIPGLLVTLFSVFVSVFVVLL